MLIPAKGQTLVPPKAGRYYGWSFRQAMKGGNERDGGGPRHGQASPVRPGHWQNGSVRGAKGRLDQTWPQQPGNCISKIYLGRRFRVLTCHDGSLRNSSQRACNSGSQVSKYVALNKTVAPCFCLLFQRRDLHGQLTYLLGNPPL